MNRMTIPGITVCLLLALVAGCAGTKPGKGYVDDTPDEIKRLAARKYKEGLHAVGTAVGHEEGIATRKATMQARAELSRQFGAEVDALLKSYEESVNNKGAGEYQETIEVFSSLQLRGSTIASSMVRKERNGLYSAKVLVVLSAERLKKLVDEQMQAYTSYRASKAYKELEGRVAREKRLSETGGEG